MNNSILTAQEVSNKLNSFFKGLEFDSESHSYKLEEVLLTPVSSTYKKYVDEPDFNMIAGFVAKSRGVSKEDILEEWAEKGRVASIKGNSLHDYAERIFEGASENPSDPYQESFMKFWNDIPKHLVPVASELQMYSKELKVAGTSDLILYNTLTGNLIIVDYKTNNDLHKVHKNQKLREPFNDLSASSLGKYTLQVSLYQLLVEQTGFNVEDRIIVWVKENEYEKFHLPSYSQKLLNDLL